MNRKPIRYADITAASGAPARARASPVARAAPTSISPSPLIDRNTKAVFDAQLATTSSRLTCVFDP